MIIAVQEYYYKDDDDASHWALYLAHVSPKSLNWSSQIFCTPFCKMWSKLQFLFYFTRTLHALHLLNYSYTSACPIDGTGSIVFWVVHLSVCAYMRGPIRARVKAFSNRFAISFVLFFGFLPHMQPWHLHGFYAKFTERFSSAFVRKNNVEPFDPIPPGIHLTERTI